MNKRFRLPYKRYEDIKKIASSKIKEWGIKSLPYNCFQLCKVLGIVLKKYSDQEQSVQKELTEFSEDAFCYTIVENGCAVRVIAYNDKMPEHRIRFSIMHEIGHIVLDHTEHSQLAEAEANFFAQYMLAPTPTLQYFLPLAASKVSFLYNISEECAKNVIIQFKNWKEKGEPFLLPYEKTLLEHLHFIPTQEVRSSI